MSPADRAGLSPAIRPAAASDLALLAALHAEIFARAPSGEAWDQEAIARILAMPGAGGLLAMASRGDQALGLALYRVAADEAEVLSIGVARRARRCGTGRRLLRAVIETVRSAGARRLYLEVSADNMPARDLYSAAGLRAVGRRANYYHRSGQPPMDALIFARTV